MVVAVLTSAQRADDVSFNREQRLIRQAITDTGIRVLRQLDSVAGTPRAALTIRAKYEPDWVARHLGAWLQTYFKHDVVLVVDGDDQVNFVSSDAEPDAAADAVRPILRPGSICCVAA